MVASELNHQIIVLLKRPLTHYWTSPLIQWKKKKKVWEQKYGQKETNTKFLLSVIHLLYMAISYEGPHVLITRQFKQIQILFWVLWQ